MLASTLIALLSFSAVLVEAAHDIRSPQTHKRPSLVRRSTKTGKQCRVKPAAVANAPSSASSAHPAPTPASSNNKGVIKIQSAICGASGATTQVTKTTGPNGKLAWLNCGVADKGWNPANVKASDLITMDLTTALKDNNSPFKACSAYLDLFNKYADEFNLPAILLASIAMQESTCNPETTGGGGEQGLMQITQDKCDGAPDGNCKFPDFNIRTGAKYFADTLASNNGNILLTIGQYNGWFQGMTVGAATAAATSKCCRCQQNLDYLHQTCNGWLQNVDPYSTGMGQYFNLNRCHSD